MLCMSMLQIKLNADGQVKWERQKSWGLFLCMMVNDSQKVDGKGVKKQQNKFNFLQKKFQQIKVDAQRINLQFEVRTIDKNKNLFGFCSSFLMKGHNRIHCMDLIDRNKKVIGGMLYEAVWSEIGPRSWINGRNLAQLRQSSNIEQESSDDEGILSIFSCFSNSKKKIKEPKKFKVVPANEMIIYEEGQLDSRAQKKNSVALFVQYYSKSA